MTENQNTSRGDHSSLFSMLSAIPSVETHLRQAVDAARRYRFTEIALEHLMLGMLGNARFRAAIEKVGGRPDDVELSLIEAFELHASTQGKSIPARLGISEAVLGIGMRIDMLAKEGEDPLVLDQELVCSIFNSASRSRVAELALEHGGAVKLLAERDSDDFFERVFDDIDFLPADQGSQIPAMRNGRIAPQDTAPGKSAADQAPSSTAKSGPQPAPAPSPTARRADRNDTGKAVEEAVGAALRDLGAAARDRKLDPCIGRETEIDMILSALRRRRKGSVLLHGDAGVGKTAIAEGVALRMRDADVDYALSSRPFYELSLGTLVADTKYRGDFESRMTHLIERLTRERAIVFIDEIHMLVGSGATYGRGMDGANILKPAMARGDVTVIGATTSSEMREIRRDAALMRRFEPIAVREPDREETRSIIDQASWTYLEYHDLDMGAGVIEEICRICDLYQPEKRFPDKAFDLLDAACVMSRDGLRSAKFGATRPKVEIAHVHGAAARLGIRRPSRPDARLARRLNGLVAALNSGIKGQDRGMSELGDAVFSAALGIRSSGARSAILLSGPEGSGKSRSAQVLANHMGLPLIRIDMKNADARSLHQLIGLPGSNGISERSGILVDAADSHAEMVLLLDDVDRCDRQMQEFVAQIISTGMFQSGCGRSISMRAAWIVMTVRDSERGILGFGRGKEDEAHLSEIEPCLRKVISSSVRLDALDEDGVREIVRDAAAQLIETLRDLGVELAISEETIDALRKRVGDGAAAAEVFSGPVEARLAREIIQAPSCRRMVLELDGESGFVITPRS